MFKPTSSCEPKYLIFFIQRGRNTAWLPDNNRTILANDGQIATLSSLDVVKAQPQPNIGHDAVEVRPILED